MPHFTTLPNEILHVIFQWLHPEDLASLARVCRGLHAFVDGNQRLCRDIYLRVLDEPSREIRVDWEQALHHLVRLKTTFRRHHPHSRRIHVRPVLETALRLLQTASSATGLTSEYLSDHLASRNAETLLSLFRHEPNRTAFLELSSLFDRVPHPARRLHGIGDPERHMSARLHCLHGPPTSKAGFSSIVAIYPYACSRVYDLRNHVGLTTWGPFMSDNSGRVDWEKLEAVYIVLGHNMVERRLTRLYGHVWQSPFNGSWPNSFVSPDEAEKSELDARDPYGVTGVWHRVVCFLDFNDFFTFNFLTGDIGISTGRRPPIHAEQAVRLITMRIHVTEIKEPSPEYHQDWPVVRFEGTSRPTDNSWDEGATSDIHGQVGITREGDVRWTTHSVYDDHDRWTSEGIQIGGVKSARGVVGHWFDSARSLRGPCGPTAFWKANDNEHAPDSLPEENLVWSDAEAGDVMFDSEEE